MTRPSGTAVEYETTDAEPVLIAWLAAGTAAFLLLTPLILQLVFPETLHREVVIGDLAGVPAPRLQINPRRELDAFRRTEEKKLSTYGWTNQDRGIVHIPIERAMDLTIVRGLPNWPKP